MTKLKTFLLALVLMSFSAGSALAQFSGGNGTADNPYIITTATQLAQLATYVNSNSEHYSSAHYRLGKDFSLSSYNTGVGWIPIGDPYGTPFSGVFDGDGHVISGLYIKTSSNQNNSITQYNALFGYIKSAVIKNVGLEDVNIQAGEYVGGIVASTSPDSDDFNLITHCYVTGTIQSEHGMVGGIAGSFGSGTITNCYTDVTVTSDGKAVGGIVGDIRVSTLSHCYAVGLVSGEEHAIGGIAGDVMETSVSNCAALNPSISASSYYGRVCGRAIYGSTLSNNMGFSDMINVNGTTNWNNVGLNKIDGADITAPQLNADGTIGDRFTASNGWTVANGKLPGLFGNMVNMPEHLYSPIPPTIITTTLPVGIVLDEYSYTLTATGDEPITWSIASGKLPKGLSLSGNTISGIPMEVENCTFTVMAENAEGSDTKELTLSIVVPPEILPTLFYGEVGKEYSKIIVRGTQPITLTVISGTLPPGLELSGNTLSGIPTQAGMFYFTLKAENAGGSDIKDLSIQIIPATGIDGLTDEVSIYPNPSSGRLNFSHEMTYEIADIQGRVLLINHSFVKEADISSLPSGTYLVRLTTQTGEVKVHRVIKE